MPKNGQTTIFIAGGLLLLIALRALRFLEGTAFLVVYGIFGSISWLLVIWTTVGIVRVMIKLPQVTGAVHRRHKSSPKKRLHISFQTPSRSGCFSKKIIVAA